MDEIEKTILKFALHNAWKFKKARIDSVLSRIIGESPELKSKIKLLIPQIKKTVDEINKLKSFDIEKKLKSLAPGLMEEKKIEEKRVLPELKNVKDRIIMRFAPFPSGALHIGNARPVILNDEYCRMYKGKLLLVIDDTIGSKDKIISKDAYKLIPEALDWLQVDYDKKIIYKSDRLEIYYKYAEDIIKKGKAYVCTCRQEVLKENRAKGNECKCRSNSIEKNLDLFKNMPTMKEGSATLRIKTSMQHANPAFRDRVLFRISDREHPRVGKSYRVWPLLEFSWAIDDHLLGITHILRGKDLMMETEMERYIWDIFKWPDREVIHTGFLAIEGVKLSKSKARAEVESGEYTGWDDPRTWSLQSLKRRGIKPDAIRNFCLNFGVTQTEINVSVDALYAENRKLIEKEANRYFFIENPREIEIKNAPDLRVSIPLHPDIPERGSRVFEASKRFLIEDRIKKGKYYRFMHLFNLKDDKYISTGLDQRLNAKLIHWLPSFKHLVDVEVLMPDGSIIKGKGESKMKDLDLGNIVQLERKFFCRLDKIEKNKFVFCFAHK